ncbi:MAG TPA: acyl-CoA dehydrogenase family protein [Micromonosporaceae bacterium]|nr:acyl-CoA dehydrogenase family protein [Micromonosporaceae bacterium]
MTVTALPSAAARTEQWQCLRERAQDLAATFEARGADGYETGRFVADNIRDLTAAGITAMNVPADLGGFDGSLAETVEIIKTVATGCGSTAFTLAIHLILTGSLRQDIDAKVRERLYTAVRDGAFVIGPFTDEGSGSNWAMPSTVARRVDDGFVLEGVKHFSTGFDAATHLVLTAGLTDEHLEPPFNLAVFLVDKPTDGSVAVARPWAGFAMPMTGSHSLRIADLAVSADDMLFPEGLTPLFFMSRQQWGHYGFSAVFLGLAERAYTLAVEATRGRRNTAVKDLRLMPGVQFAVAQMRSALGTMNALLTEYAERHIDPGEDLTRFVADTCVPKYFVTNEAVRVVTLAMQVVGGSAIRERGRLSQIWRDVTAGPLLPFTNDLAREFIGKAALGIDPIATPRWL